MSPSRGNPVSRFLRKMTKFLWAKASMEHLESIRSYELDFAKQFFPCAGKVLEIGAGTGWQAQALQYLGLDVQAIDLNSSIHKENRIFPVIDYDGCTIPFGDGAFDVVFSSNVLEHIPRLQSFQQEIHRVLKTGGVAVHIVPSGTWRFWTNITHILRAWKVPDTHGEHSANALMEILRFRKICWRKLFEETGWQVCAAVTCPIFYTGRSLLGPKISLRNRHRISYVLGGSTNLFVLRKLAPELPCA